MEQRHRQPCKTSDPCCVSWWRAQINLLVGQLVASQETGAISFLYFADRLYQLPLGIAGIAVGTVLLQNSLVI